MVSSDFWASEEAVFPPRSGKCHKSGYGSSDRPTSGLPALPGMYDCASPPREVRNDTSEDPPRYLKPTPNVNCPPHLTSMLTRNSLTSCVTLYWQT
jgi:hypothetical protein